MGEKGEDPSSSNSYTFTQYIRKNSWQRASCTHAPIISSQPLQHMSPTSASWVPEAHLVVVGGPVRVRVQQLIHLHPALAISLLCTCAAPLPNEKGTTTPHNASFSLVVGGPVRVHVQQLIHLHPSSAIRQEVTSPCPTPTTPTDHRLRVHVEQLVHLHPP